MLVAVGSVCVECEHRPVLVSSLTLVVQSLIIGLYFVAIVFAGLLRTFAFPSGAIRNMEIILNH